MPDKDNLCAHANCNNIALKRCSGCQEVWYCNREHQRSHWKNHKKNCSPYKMAVNDVLGRHYVATKDIKVGEIVMHDKAPLLTGFKTRAMVCAGCYTRLSNDNAKICDKCGGWPLCYDCTKHGFECEFAEKHLITKLSITEFAVNASNFYSVSVSIVRALALRETDPDAYQRLLQLEGHVGKPRYSFIDDPQRIARGVKCFYQLDDIEEEEIARIAAIIDVNAFRKCNRDYGYWYEISVFDKSSYIEHSCLANCSTTSTADGGKLIWAAVPIFKGDHISIEYVEGTWSTLQRRNVLCRDKFFHCTCERCTDPTEFGTMFSAFRCFKEKCTGFILPSTLGKDEKNLDFACSECKAIKPWADVDKLEQEMITIMSQYEQANVTLESLDDSKKFAEKYDKANVNLKSLDNCKKFAEKHANILHENHFFKFFIDAYTIVNQIFCELTSLSNQQLRDRIVRSEKLIELFEILSPSSHYLRGLLLYSLYLAKSDKLKENIVENDILALRQHIFECKKILKKAHELLYHEQPFSDTAKLVAQLCLLHMEAMGTFECFQGFSELKTIVQTLGYFTRPW